MSGIWDLVRALKARVQRLLNVSILSRLFISFAVLIFLALSLYWNFGFQDILIKSIPTEGRRVVDVSINPEFLVGLITILLFYLGYKGFVDSKQGQTISSPIIESRKQIIMKFLFSIALGVIGLWVIYMGFGNVNIWSYVTSFLMDVSKEATINETDISVSLVLTVLVLLLLLNWYITPKVRRGHKETK